MNLEPIALEEFEAACTLFRSAADTSPRAARALVSVILLLKFAFI